MKIKILSDNEMIVPTTNTTDDGTAVWITLEWWRGEGRCVALSVYAGPWGNDNAPTASWGDVDTNGRRKTTGVWIVPHRLGGVWLLTPTAHGWVHVDAAVWASVCSHIGLRPEHCRSDGGTVPVLLWSSPDLTGMSVEGQIDTSSGVVSDAHGHKYSTATQCRWERGVIAYRPTGDHGDTMYSHPAYYHHVACCWSGGANDNPHHLTAHRPTDIGTRWDDLPPHQHLVKEMVQRGVTCNVSSLVTTVSSHGLTDDDSLLGDAAYLADEMALHAHCGEARCSNGDCGWSDTTVEGDEPCECPDCGADVEFDPGAEILEWWLVSDWLSERLSDCGEIVSSEEMFDVGYVWGRVESGQALHIDSVMQRIYTDMIERV